MNPTDSWLQNITRASLQKSRQRLGVRAGDLAHQQCARLLTEVRRYLTPSAVASQFQMLLIIPKPAL